MSFAVARILDAVRALDPVERAEFELALTKLEPPVCPKPAPAAIGAAYGKLRHVPTSVEEFLQRKRADLDLE